MNKIFIFSSFVIRPLFSGGRWLAWPFIALIIVMMGGTITAFRMEIPDKSNVYRIQGELIDTGKGYRRSTLFDIGIKDSNGLIHKCNCEPKPHSNCLIKIPSALREIIPKQAIPNKTIQYEIINWAKGKDSEIWLHPNKNTMGSGNSCYQITVNGLTLLTFEESVATYEKAKQGIDIYFLWLFMMTGTIGFLIFLVAQINLFLKEGSSGKSGS